MSTDKRRAGAPANQASSTPRGVHRFILILGGVGILLAMVLGIPPPDAGGQASGG